MTAKEANRTTHVAEGATLSALIAVKKAYANTDAPVMVGRMLHDARWPSRLAVLASPLAVIGAIKWQNEFSLQAAAVVIFGCFYWFKRDAFRTYYTRKETATFLDTFTTKAQAIRYIMFRENVSNTLATDTFLLDRLLRLLEQRQRVRRAGVVTRHPIVTSLVAIFLILMGVLISKAADASIPATLTATFLVGMMILMAMQLGIIWRTGEYRDEELSEFVLWLWAEATESSTPPPANTQSNPT